MQMEIKDGWLVETPVISRIPSPNYDKRPNNPIDLLVIHHISLPPYQYGREDIIAFFTNQLKIEKHDFYKKIQNIRVSSHLLIQRNGQIVQLVNFNARAWHAGQSCYQGRQACNDFSIGIELEGDDKTPYRYAQYKTLIEVTKLLRRYYPIGNHIVGHEHIAPGRKKDPGPTFDWQRYLGGL